jgi:hypothetical protein
VPARVVLYVPAGVAVLAVIADTAIHGQPHSVTDWLAPIGPAVVASAILLWLFDRILWKLPGIRRLTGRPLIDGTWKGTIATDWRDPETGQRRAPDDETFLVVFQCFWRITVRLLTRESASRSIRADLTRHPDGSCDLVYLYRNEPGSEVRHRSEIQYGGTRLMVPRDPSGVIEGDYFTDRKTNGRMTFGDRVAGHPAGYADAAALHGGRRGRG